MLLCTMLLESQILNNNLIDQNQQKQPSHTPTLIWSSQIL